MLRAVELIQQHEFKQSFDQHAQHLENHKVQMLQTVFHQLVKLFILSYRKKFAITFAVPAATFLIVGIILTSHTFSLPSSALILFIVYAFVFIEMTKPFRYPIKELRTEIKKTLERDVLLKAEVHYLFQQIPELKKFL